MTIPNDVNDTTGNPHAETKPPETPLASAPALPSAEETVAALEKDLAAAEEKNLTLQADYLRARADVENARRRAAEEVSKARKFAVEAFAADMLGVKDSLEAALSTPAQTVETFRHGVGLTLKQVNAAFEKNALVEIYPMGEKFDPHRHQAIGAVETDSPPNTVITVLQKGCLIAERVLRPALVMVAKAFSPTPPAPVEEKAVPEEKSPPAA